jgi:hypothetical protein
MQQVKTLFPPASLQRDAWFGYAPQLVAAYRAGQYRAGPAFYTRKAGEDAVEEAFDLSNNPSRQDERDLVFGDHRSVSVGDIVEVGSDAYLCKSSGWEKL